MLKMSDLRTGTLSLAYLVGNILSNFPPDHREPFHGYIHLLQAVHRLVTRLKWAGVGVGETHMHYSELLGGRDGET